MGYYLDYMNFSRKFRSRYLHFIVHPLNKIGVKANHLTFLSLIFGLISVYFLFKRNDYFIIFGLAHLFLDALDGVLARETQETKLGAKLDYFIDQFVALALLVKTFFVLEDFLIESVVFANVVLLSVVVAYVLHHAIYVISRYKIPVVYSRTTLFVLYILGLHEIGYIVAGVISVYGIVLQVRNYHLTVLRPK